MNSSPFAELSSCRKETQASTEIPDKPRAQILVGIGETSAAPARRAAVPPPARIAWQDRSRSRSRPFSGSTVHPSPRQATFALSGPFDVATENHVVGFFDRLDTGFELQRSARRLEFVQEHADDVLGAVVTEELAEGFLVPGNAVLFDKRQEILLGVALERRNAEARVLRQKIRGRAVQDW